MWAVAWTTASIAGPWVTALCDSSSNTTDMLAIDVRGALEDAPDFRRKVNVAEESIAVFETSIKSLVKLAKVSVSLGDGKPLYQRSVAVGA